VTTGPEPWVREWPTEPEVQCMCGERMPQALWFEHMAERPGALPRATALGGSEHSAPAVEQAVIDIPWIVASSDDGNDMMAEIRAVLAALVRAAEQRGAEKARREDGEHLRHVNSWDEVGMLIQVWRAGVPPCGAVTKRLGFPQTCLREPGHMLPGHSDGTRGGAW
jgi:hypothetical protein